MKPIRCQAGRLRADDDGDARQSSFHVARWTYWTGRVSIANSLSDNVHDLKAKFSANGKGLFWKVRAGPRARS